MEDVELIRIVQANLPGSRSREGACTELVRRYQQLVQGCAARYLNSPEPLEELIQAGYVGLLSAINHFDPLLGTSLAAYARPCISGEIKRHFRDRRWQVHVRRGDQETRAEVLAAESVLTQLLLRKPTDLEIGCSAGMTIEQVREGRHADLAFEAMSLDRPLSADAHEGTLGDLLGEDDHELAAVGDMHAVWGHMTELPDREQRMLLMRFYGNMTQSQIGERLGISQMHVSRLLSHALGFLRDRLSE